MRRLTFLCLVTLLNGCAMLPAPNANLYEMHRDAQLAYDGDQDVRAEKLFLGLSRAAPNDPETWFYLGNLYARTNRPEQAAEAYQKSLMLKGDQAKVWHNIGVVRVREAWAALIQAYSLTPLDDPLHARLEGLISAMEKIPLDGLKRGEKSAPITATPAAAAPADNGQ